MTKLQRSGWLGAPARRETEPVQISAQTPEHGLAIWRSLRGKICSILTTLPAGNLVDNEHHQIRGRSLSGRGFILTMPQSQDWRRGEGRRACKIFRG